MFLLLLSFCSVCTPKLLLISSVCQSTLVSTLNLDFQRTSHFLTTLTLRVCFFQSILAGPDEIQAEQADTSGSKLPSLSVQAGVRNSCLKQYECVCGTGYCSHNPKGSALWPGRSAEAQHGEADVKSNYRPAFCFCSPVVCVPHSMPAQHGSAFPQQIWR